MNRPPSVSQVAAVLEILVRFHPAGLGVLLGRVPPPEASEIAAVLSSFADRGYLGVRIAGGRAIPEAERVLFLSDAFLGIINAAGGWERICRAAREVRETVSPSFWREAADYAAYIAQGGKIRDGRGGFGKRLFSTAGNGKHEISGRTARRHFRGLLRIIALEILSFPPDGDFRLVPSTSGNFPA
jgi:hypothetical protein